MDGPSLRSRGCAEAHPYNGWVDVGEEDRREERQELKNDNADALNTKGRSASTQAGIVGEVHLGLLGLPWYSAFFRSKAAQTKIKPLGCARRRQAGSG